MCVCVCNIIGNKIVESQKRIVIFYRNIVLYNKLPHSIILLTNNFSLHNTGNKNVIRRVESIYYTNNDQTIKKNNNHNS